MEFTSIFLQCILYLGLVSAYTFQEDYEDFNQILKIISKPRVLDRYSNNGGNFGVKSFSWKNCGSSSDVIQIKNVQLSPDPIKLPGNVTVSAAGSLTSSLSAPIQVTLDIQKKVLFWVTVPCMDNVGSCTYDDICTMLFPKQPCPPVFVQHKVPCHCPFKAGTYSFDNLKMFVDPKGLPSWLEDGDYWVKATMSQNGKQLACISMYLSITN